jgi:WD40 repeat protein
VSALRFLDDATLVTAAADSTLKLWHIAGALPTSSSPSLSCMPSAPSPAAVLRGHVAHKHAAPLDAAPGGYLACGAEDHAVYLYHAATSAPALRHELPCVDGVRGGGATAAPPGARVSALAYGAGGRALLAGSSTGVVQLLRVVS